MLQTINDGLFKLGKWGKLLLPHHFLKFYPPIFILRNPVKESVYSSFRKGYYVTAIVFKLTITDMLADQININQTTSCRKKVNYIFKKSVVDCISLNEIVVLQDYFQDGFALILRRKDDLLKIEKVIKQIRSHFIKSIIHIYPNLTVKLEAGYSDMESSGDSVEHHLFLAYQQAASRIERGIKSQYNEMRFELKSIITNKQINLLAQPIIDLASNEIKAWEMLSRGPKGTLYESPLQLFSIAKQTNLLFRLEIFILEQAFSQIIENKCEHLVFVNFTPKTLGNPKFISLVKQLLFRYREVRPSNMIFEVTEGESIEGSKYFHKNIKELRSLGIRVAIDDTGSGYSSLSMISKIMPDIIKIDQSVIRDIDKNKVKESMLKGLLLVAKEMGSLVVAEGIEKIEEADVLSRNNVDLAQGYYYAKPGIMARQSVS